MYTIESLIEIFNKSEDPHLLEAGRRVIAYLEECEAKEQQELMALAEKYGFNLTKKA